MSDPIRWDDLASLELFNTVTGETAPVVAWRRGGKNWPDSVGLYWLDDEPDGADCAYRANGKPEDQASCPDWIIRNKPCCDAAKELADFKREVSDAVKALLATGKAYDAAHPVVRDKAFWDHCESVDALRHFIQPEPVDPVEAAIEQHYMRHMVELGDALTHRDRVVAVKEAIRAGIKIGLTITEGESK